MNHVLLVLPFLIPLLTAAFLWCLPWRRHGVVALAGGGLHLAAAWALFAAVRGEGVLALQAGQWAAPFGITLAADLLGALLVLMTAFLGFGVLLYSLAGMDDGRTEHGYYPLVHLLLMGVSGAFLTGDLFNLYVWFEILLMASFVLLVLGGERSQLEGALMYVVLNLVSSALFLAGVGILYGAAGTLNMADLARTVPQVPAGGVTAAAALLFVGFGLKAAIFPLFGWLPASYATPPPAVTALFSGLLTKVGVYAIIRLWTLVFRGVATELEPVLFGTAILTMVVGVLGAVAQKEMRRLLSFHIVSQIGYLLLGLAIGTVRGLAGTIYFLIHVSIAKAALFLVSGIVLRLRGSTSLPALGGLYVRHPGLAVLFLLPALSLAGLPPLSGFFAKFLLVDAGLASGHSIAVAVALGVSVLTLFSMLKIWNEAFWKPMPDGAVVHEPLVPWLLPIATAVLGGMSVLLGVGAEWLVALSMRAASQLLDPEPYLRAVLGG